MKNILVLSVLLLLVSCASGQVYVAKDRNDGIRSTYNEAQLRDMSQRHHALLQDLYGRFQQAQVDVVPNGIGFTSIVDSASKKHTYLLIQLRPRGISFGEHQTTPEQRFATVFSRHFEENLRFVKKEDVDRPGVEGLALAVYWPVRDLSQCDTYGGFLEYTIIYFSKPDLLEVLSGRQTFRDCAKKSEVYTSLGLKNAEAVTIKD